MRGERNTVSMRTSRDVVKAASNINDLLNRLKISGICFMKTIPHSFLKMQKLFD